MKLQLAKLIFLTVLSILKKVLDLFSFKIGKESEDYKYMREQIFDYFYRQTKNLFKQLETNKILKRCSCSANLRKGYQDCENCGGSGYINFENEEK